MNAILIAVKLFGSRQALGKALGVTGEAIRKWQNSRVPAERCHDIVRIVNERHPGSITLHDLRPDLWPASEPAKEAA